MADDELAGRQKRITVTLSADEHQLLRTLAFLRGRSMSQAARRLISEGIYDETGPGGMLVEGASGAVVLRFRRDGAIRGLGITGDAKGKS
jgi:hypothetical protein